MSIELRRGPQDQNASSGLYDFQLALSIVLKEFKSWEASTAILLGRAVNVILSARELARD